MKLVPLAEFQHLCALSDAALLWLLKSNKLNCGIDAQQGLCVDIDSADNTAMLEAIRARRVALASEHAHEFAEELGAILEQEFEALVSEVLARKS